MNRIELVKIEKVEEEIVNEDYEYNISGMISIYTPEIVCLFDVVEDNLIQSSKVENFDHERMTKIQFAP